MVHAVLFSATVALYTSLNAERRSRGLHPLIVDARLAQAASAHAADMAQDRYFSHRSPEGATPFDRIRQAGCSYRYAGENIALAPDEPSAGLELFESPLHRDNILSPNFRHVGIGVARDAEGDMLFVEDFSG